jgi:diacylglycerol kinase family enzyme
MEVLLISIANSDQYGNGALVAPGARADDGLLDLVAVRPVSLLGALPLGIRLFSGSFDRSSRVHHLQGARFLIERPAPGLVHTDGEVHAAAASLEIAVHPQSLRMAVPRASGRAMSERGRLNPDSPCQPFALNL